MAFAVTHRRHPRHLYCPLRPRHRRLQCRLSSKRAIPPSPPRAPSAPTASAGPLRVAAACSLVHGSIRTTRTIAPSTYVARCGAATEHESFPCVRIEGLLGYEPPQAQLARGRMRSLGASATLHVVICMNRLWSKQPWAPGRTAHCITNLCCVVVL